MNPTSRNVASARNRLIALQSSIENICRIAGTPGISIGVVQEERLIYSFNGGYSEVESGACVDQETVFYIASMSEAFKGLALAYWSNQGS